VLLRAEGFRFAVDAADIDEAPRADETPEQMVERLARAKGSVVARRSPGGARVIDADTLVVLDSEILGKPRVLDEARSMLRRLSGRTHRVLTGYALCRGEHEIETGVEASHVSFREVPSSEAEAYLATGECLDKAGAYAVQGGAAGFVAHIDGSRSNVIGLPMEAVVPLLARHGVFPH